jgi:hypothetical protein
VALFGFFLYPSVEGFDLLVCEALAADCDALKNVVVVFGDAEDC